MSDTVSRIVSENESSPKATIRLLSDYAMEMEVAFHSMKQRAETAEARIKASQEQEPVWYAVMSEEAPVVNRAIRSLDGAHEYADGCKENYGVVSVINLYSAPVIPPDVAELQRENAELTRKLAESEKVSEHYFDQLCSSVRENQKLLAEANSKAVPEGWKLVPIEPTYGMRLRGQGTYAQGVRDVDVPAWLATLIYKAMLLAAPSPETDIDNSRGSNETCEEN